MVEWLNVAAGVVRRRGAAANGPCDPPPIPQLHAVRGERAVAQAAIRAEIVSTWSARQLAGSIVAVLAASVLLAAPSRACTGDCDGNDQVNISELMQGVNIVLGREPVSQCPEFD